MAYSPFLDLYPTSKISGNKLSEEEIAYYRKKEAAKRGVCGEEGCGVPLAGDNKTGKCSIHGGSKYENVNIGKYHKKWRDDFFRAFGALKERGHKVTRDSLDDILIDRPIDKWLEVLRREGYLVPRAASVLYERVKDKPLSEESATVKQIVEGVESLVIQNAKRSFCMTEIQKYCGVTPKIAKLALKNAVGLGYLKAVEPAQEVTLTKKGKQFLAKLGY
ncbi:MAG: hypothetical protein Q7S53_05500 [bacterium]|nr:hypothetical protein [bacterium]